MEEFFKNALKNAKAVVIGTSWGGFLALKKIFSYLPPNFSFPIIIVQHVHKDSNTFEPHIYQTQGKSPLHIQEVDEWTKLSGGTIYFAPPDYHLLVERDYSLSLSADLPDHKARPSIDMLFKSAAQVYGEMLVGIILTGANSDGAIGLKEIQDFGGAAIIQNPKEAEHSEMPQAAIYLTGSKYIFTLDEIGKLFEVIGKNGNN